MFPLTKRALIIHGFGGHADSGWKPWLKRELEILGWKVFLPQMPNTDHPVQKEWVELTSKLLGKPDEKTFLVGHSLGCDAILRYLESLPSGCKVGGIVLIACPVSKPRVTQLESFFTKPFDWEKIESVCPSSKIIVMNSDNDPLVKLSEGRILEKELGAKLVICPGKGHFSSSEGNIELKEALDALLQVSRD
jgi:predicted alpha/beta hydrolase family esterase